MMVYSDSSLCFTISEILPDAFNFPFSGCESEEKDGLVSQSTPPPPQQQEPSSDDQEQDNSYGGGGGQIIANPTSYFAKLWSTLDMLPKETPKNRRGRRPGVKSLKRTAKKNRQLVEFRLPKSAPFASSITASALSSIPASPSAVIGGTTSDVHAFISSLPRTAGVLDYMRAYLLKIMSPDSNTCAVIAWSSDAFGEIIVKMIQRLEKYGAGLSFWSALDNCKGADMKYNQLYLAICEVLYQQVILQTENLQKSNLFGAQFEMALAESTQFVNDFPTEYSNQSTLLSNSLWKMLWRYWAVVSSNLSVWMVDQESAEGGTNRIEESLSDLRLISRYLFCVFSVITASPSKV